MFQTSDGIVDGDELQSETWLELGLAKVLMGV